MKITRIEVENFKSIERYDFEVDDFNVFIGKNNHGKTNLFDALDWFDSGKTASNFYRNNDSTLTVTVRVHFNEAQEGLSSLPDGAYKTKIAGLLGEQDEFIVEKTSTTDKRSVIVDGQNLGNPTGIDPALNYFLPKIVYVTTKHKLADVAGYKAKSPIAEMLADVLKDMVDNEPRYRTFLEMFDELFNEQGSVFRTAVNDLQSRVETYLAKQFAEGATVRFRIENPAVEDMLKKFETDVDDGINTKAEEKGDGMQRAIMLAIVQAYADYRRDKGIARSFLFLIDEAELHLHPTAQRLLKQALRDIVDNGGQVLINSHSPIFANESFENQILYQVEKVAGQSSLKVITSPQEQLESIYQLLGGSPRDILLPSNFIIVEGRSELEFLKIVISKFWNDEPRSSQIQILMACGDHDRADAVYNRVHDAYTPLLTNGVYRDKVVVMLDHPTPEKEVSFAEFQRLHPSLVLGEHLHILPENAVELYYPAPHTRTAEETAVMTTRDKTELGINVANAFESLADLERNMPVIVTTIRKAIEFAHG